MGRLESGHKTIQTASACLCAFTLSLIGLSAGGDPGAVAAQRTAAAGSNPCSLVQKKPLFVAFAPGMVLDDFEPAARASRDILRGLKATLCKRAPRSADVLMTPSLRAALATRRPVQSSEVRFDDRNFSHAHVVLSDISRPKQSAVAWRAHFERAETGWTVTRTSDEPIAATPTP
jgi:hypothetical protein